LAIGVVIGLLTKATVRGTIRADLKAIEHRFQPVPVTEGKL
jgi:hypothetical protein